MNMLFAGVGGYGKRLPPSDLEIQLLKLGLNLKRKSGELLATFK